MVGEFFFWKKFWYLVMWCSKAALKLQRASKAGILVIGGGAEPGAGDDLELKES